MAPLRRLALAFLLSAAAPLSAAESERWSAYVAEASARFGVPQGWILKVMDAESGGETTAGGRLIVSRAGAMGLMQLMPGTWAEMRDRYGLGRDPFDPHDNVLAGAAYLRAMYDRFGYPGLFAAYNAGPTRYADHLSTGRSLPAETRAYLAKVTGTSAPGAERLHPIVVAIPWAALRAAPASGLFALPPSRSPGTAAKSSPATIARVGTALEQPGGTLFAIRH